MNSMTLKVMTWPGHILPSLHHATTKTGFSLFRFLLLRSRFPRLVSSPPSSSCITLTLVSVSSDCRNVQGTLLIIFVGSAIISEAGHHDIVASSLAWHDAKVELGRLGSILTRTCL